MARKRVLVIAPHSSYRTTAFLNAANRLEVDILFASEGRYSVISAYADGLHIDLADPHGALRTIVNAARDRPFSGIIGTDDATTELAAAAAGALGLRHNPGLAVRAARRKDLARAILTRNQVPVPPYLMVDLRQPLQPQAEQVVFPCVLKPLTLSASRGVIRTDNQDEFIRACIRIKRLLEDEDVAHRHTLLAEAFIPGKEVSLEGILTDGSLKVLAIFDKPDPLDGPFFEETYYIMPSRLNRSVLAEVKRRVSDACRAYGLREGPIHAECRVNESGVWILEVAARTIGGLCARLLQFGTGYSLEELVLSHAMGQPLAPTAEPVDAGGVLMIPVPGDGILRRVEGVTAAAAVPWIEEITILTREGSRMVPWPEGSGYPGFIFARAPTPEQAESALRQAHAHLNFVLAPLWQLQPDPAHASTVST